MYVGRWTHTTYVCAQGLAVRAKVDEVDGVDGGRERSVCAGFGLGLDDNSCTR
jgi:hypothetical protein